MAKSNPANCPIFRKAQWNDADNAVCCGQPSVKKR
jgi:hypothetical protein